MALPAMPLGVLLLLLVVAGPGAGAGECRYAPNNGIYFSTYGGALQQPVVPASAMHDLDLVLAYPYVRGVAHYQNWSVWEIQDGVYNWTVLDGIFDAASRHSKHVILGLQIGVCAPEWLLLGGARTGVRTVEFVHANPGWATWSTVQRHTQGYVTSTMGVPWDPVYQGYAQRAVEALAARYARHLQLAYVNVAGPSASGGVEANFNVNYNASRLVNPGYDRELNFTLATYAATWQRTIDAYLPLFPRCGMATHNEPGSQGWDARRGEVVGYSPAERLQAARSIRDHLIAAHGRRNPGVHPIVRCCGGSNKTAVWGEPNTTADKPPADTYALLMWEIRQGPVAVGFEPATVQVTHGVRGPGMKTMLDIDLYYNGRFLELKRPDLMDANHRPQPLYRGVLAAAAAAIRPGAALPWNCSARGSGWPH